MGDFVIKVKAVGGHGCQREIGDGQEVHGCRSMDCPDCITREFVAKLQATGSSVIEATLTHWPGRDNSVMDNLLTKKRIGSFG